MWSHCFSQFTIDATHRDMREGGIVLRGKKQAIFSSICNWINKQMSALTLGGTQTFSTVPAHCVEELSWTDIPSSPRPEFQPQVSDFAFYPMLSNSQYYNIVVYQTFSNVGWDILWDIFLINRHQYKASMFFF